MPVDGSDWSSTSTPQTPSYFVFTKPIEQSQQDDRAYRLIRLESGLHAMLVHDARADQAAASLNVAVGHLSDPDDMPGMAHFCEHLLFMGTEQYPRENEYSEFLASNNGSSNAYTTPSNTVFHFTVASPFLSPALSRFAAFFHSPLFSPSCTSREINTIDSENKKNLQVDLWRIFQLNKHLSIDGHVWRKFGSGNRESLSSAAKHLKANGPDACRLDNFNPLRNVMTLTPEQSRIPSPVSWVVSSYGQTDNDGGSVGCEMRRRLLEWWNREYCASRMRLCVIGNESLEELANLVSKLFSPILDRGQDPVPLISQHPFGPNEKGTFVTVQTVAFLTNLELSFPLDYQPPQWRYKPALILGHLVGHEGPGSLHSYLTCRGWITSLSAGPQSPARGFSMFRVKIRLTSDGFKNYRQVLLTIFKYLNMVRSLRLPPWYQREVSDLSMIQFDFMEKCRPDSYAIWISEHMLWPVPPESFLKAPQVVEPWDKEVGSAEKEFQDMLKVLRIDQARVMLMARAEELDQACGASVQWEIEPWYGTPYRVERFDEVTLILAQSPNDIPELFLPKPNEFIPGNLNVDKAIVTNLKCPCLIRMTPFSMVWHKKDDQFWVPKAHINIKIQTSLANDSARNWTLTRLYSELVDDSLNEFAYDATLAELAYNFAAVPTGICILISGYNDKISVLTRHIIQKAKSLIVNPKRLEVMKEKVRRDWENFSLGQPYKISNWHARHLLTKRQWTVQDGLSEISSVTVEELQGHVKRLLSDIRLSVLITGNLHRKESLDIVDMIEGILDSSPIPHQLIEPALILPPGSNFVWRVPIPNPAQRNSSLTYYVHFGRLTSQRTRVVLALLAQILAEPVFDVLRTKEQLGYVVCCNPWELKGSCDGGITIVIQSERHPEFLERRVDAFLDSMKNVIDDMSQTQFDEQKAGLEHKWRQRPKNLAEETSLYWDQIDSGRLEFLRKEHDADLLRDIDKRDVLSMFLDAVHPSSSTRAKLSVHLYSQMPPTQKITVASAEAFEQLVKDSSLVTDQHAWTWRNEPESDGTYSATIFERHWKEILGGNEVSQELIKAIPRLIGVEPWGMEHTDNGVIYIEDVEVFKALLTVSECSEFSYMSSYQCGP